MEAETETSFSSLARFALANLGEGLKEHVQYYVLIAALGIVLTLGSPRTFGVVPLQWLFPFFALAFAMRRFDPGFRMTIADVVGIVLIGFIQAIAIVVPILLLGGIPLIVLLAIVPAMWLIVKWSLAAPLFLTPTSPRRSPVDALRDS